jgi:mannose-6-phosphate isomerase-like protein (cupin superfamily)
MAEIRSFDPHYTYVHLRGDDRSSTVEATSEFWPDVMSGKRKFDGRMLMAFRMSEDMAYWEMHPAGEELIYLTVGAMKVVLDETDGERSCSVSAGEAYLIPQGVWHRFVIGEAVELIAITAGEGTQHRAYHATGEDQ